MSDENIDHDSRRVSRRRLRRRHGWAWRAVCEIAYAAKALMLAAGTGMAGERGRQSARPRAFRMPKLVDHGRPQAMTGAG